MMAPEIQFDTFAAWLEACDDRTTFTANDEQRCPLARYVQASLGVGNLRAEVHSTIVCVDSSSRDLPSWAMDYAEAVDRLPQGIDGMDDWARLPVPAPVARGILVGLVLEHESIVLGQDGPYDAP